MNIETLKTFTAEQAFYPEESQSARNAAIGLEDNLRHTQKSDKRRLLDFQRVSNAAKHLDSLPQPGETIHAIMKGNYDGFDVVPAVVQLGGKIRQLDVCTLGFNRRNAYTLIEMIDAGQVERCRFICSVYYRANEPEVFDYLFNELTARGCSMVACRCHCKIILFEMDSGQNYVIESSANLRSCRMLEQFTMTHDKDVLEFHREWMKEMIKKGGER